MLKKLRHILLFFCIVLNFGLSAQSEWRSFLPKIEPSTDFSIWTSLNYNFSQIHYDAGGVNPINFLSNNRLSQTIGIDYASYTLEYTFRLPFNTMDKNSPLSNYYRFSTGYGKDNWEIDGYFGRVQGWFELDAKNVVSETELDTRYREDIRVFSMGLTGFYFLSKQYRYSHAMKSAYLQNKSGYTFYASLKQKYHWLNADSSLYSSSAELISNPMISLNRMFVFENSMTFGFTGLWTDGNWFLRGLVGFGPGIQLQNYHRAGRSRMRPFISPALDAKMSFGYKTNGLYLSVNYTLDGVFAYLPKQTFYYHNAQMVSFSIGFQMHDLIRDANKRNVLDGFQAL
jgi:hypothetical protein